MLTAKVSRQEDSTPKVVIDDSEIDIIAAALSATVTMGSFGIANREMSSSNCLTENGNYRVAGCEDMLVFNDERDQDRQTE